MKASVASFAKKVMGCGTAGRNEYRCGSGGCGGYAGKQFQLGPLAVVSHPYVMLETSNDISTPR